MDYKNQIEPVKVWKELVKHWGGDFIDIFDPIFSGLTLFQNSGQGRPGRTRDALPLISLSDGNEETLKKKFDNLQGKLGPLVADFIKTQLSSELVEQVGIVCISMHRDSCPYFIKNIFNESGIGIRFHGRKDLEFFCRSYDKLYNKYFSDQANLIESLKRQVSAQATKIKGLEGELTTYRNDYKNLVELNQRVRKADAWRKLISMTLHRAHSFLGGILLQTDNMRVSPHTTWSIKDLDEIDETVIGLTKRLNELEGRDIGPVILGEMEINELLPQLKKWAVKMGANPRIAKRISGTVSISLNRLEDAIRELLSNANIWTEKLKNPTVWFNVNDITRADGKRFLEILIKDNGPGVKPDLKEAIFLPLVSFRLGGTGRGLSMVAKVIEEMKGDVFENGKYGEGAQFIIHLPILELQYYDKRR